MDPDRQAPTTTFSSTVDNFDQGYDFYVLQIYLLPKNFVTKSTIVLKFIVSHLFPICCGSRLD